MFSLGTTSDSTILRVRVKGSDLDPLALRGRLENLLGDISFQPRLPPSAMLFIRKLNDPMPGLLQLDTPYPRAPEPWRHAFSTRFDQLVTGAARPALGPVADSAESVVFYDYAELLASLSADWCSGSVNTRWWWQTFIKRADIRRILRQLWGEKIEYVPAALEHLVKRHALVEFVSALRDEEVHEIVRRVVQVFGLNEIRRVIGPRIERIEETDLAREPGRVVEQIEVQVAATPWKQIVPETESPRFTPEQQLFVGIGLMLRRAPTRARTVAFAREVEQWQQQEEVRAPHVVVTREATVIESNQEAAAPIEVKAADDPIVEMSATTAVSEDNRVDVTVAPIPESPKREQVKIGNAVFTHEEAVVISQPIVTETEVVEEDRPAPEETVIEDSASRAVIPIETELGGLFYLINLGIFLEIYSDFTNPVEQFTELSIWDFVTLVGADLLGDFDEHDPVWSLLNNLANPDNPENPVSKPSWLKSLLPDIRTRLHQALAINYDIDLAAVLLRHYAKVTVTPTHLDVYFALAEHPIEIRLSGLDRNPGWVPAAGRFIAFHYD
jgi:hypothetical protein